MTGDFMYKELLLKLLECAELNQDNMEPETCELLNKIQTFLDTQDNRQDFLGL